MSRTLLFISLGSLASLLFGSRLSYFIFTFNGRYFPEPFVLIICLVLFVFRPRLCRPLVSAFARTALFVLPSLVLTFLSVTPLDTIYQYLRNFLFLGVPFAVLLSDKTPLFSRARVSPRGVLLVLSSFSFSSILFGILSIYVAPKGLETVLTFYGGLRSLQPDLAPVVLFSSLLLLSNRTSKPWFTWFLALCCSSLSVLIFFFSLNRATLIPGVLVLLYPLVVRSIGNSRAGFAFSISKSFSSLLGLIFFVFLFALLSRPLLELLSYYSQSFAYTDSLGQSFSKLSLLEQQVDRFTASTGESSVPYRLTLLFLPFANPHFFVFPRPFDPFSITSELSALSSSIVGVQDSGFLTLFSFFGLFLLLPVLVFAAYRCIRISQRLLLLDSAISMLPILLLSSLLLALYSNDTLIRVSFGAFGGSSVVLLILFLESLASPVQQNLRPSSTARG